MSSPFGQIDTETFLREYWQKKPLLIRNAFPGFESPVSADELAGMALEEEVESRLIIQSPSTDDWQLKHGPLCEEDFAELPENHWTLLIQAVDHWLPEVAELMQQFSFVPNWRLDDLMISYAADGGGVGPHYDNYDVFLIQAEGTRRWEIGGIYGDDSPRRPDLPVLILPEWDPEQSWDLQPGDMLYLPPGVGHNGYAVGDGCMTYSVGFRAPSKQELLNGFSRFLENLSAEDKRYADPDLTPQENPGEISAHALERVRSILMEQIDNPEQLAQWFGTYMTESKYPETHGNQEDCPEEEISEGLEQGFPVCRTEGSRFAYTELESGFILYADGQSYPCSTEQIDCAKQLCAQPLNSALIPTPANIELLGKLFRQGSLYFADLDS